MGIVYAPDPLINVSLGFGPGGGSSSTGCGCSSSSIYALCPANAGNGLANNPPGVNPMQAAAIVYVPAFKAVAMGTNGVTLADNANPAHRDVVLGLSDNNYTPGAMVNIYHGGPITNPIPGVGGWNWVVNDPIWLQSNGDLAQSLPPSGFIQKMGFALSSNTMMIRLGDSEGVPTVVSYTYAATINFDCRTTDVGDITLTGPATINFTGGEDGQEVYVRATQDAIGGQAITWGAMVAFPGAVPPGQTLTALRTDVYRLQYNAALTKYVVIDADLDLA